MVDIAETLQNSILLSGIHKSCYNNPYILQNKDTCKKCDFVKHISLHYSTNPCALRKKLPYLIQ